MDKIKELIANIGWMVRTLVGVDQIVKEDGAELMTLRDLAFLEVNELFTWKDAIDEACALDFIPVTTPKETLANLIAWNVKQALDPAISKDANDLIERGRNEK